MDVLAQLHRVMQDPADNDDLALDPVDEEVSGAANNARNSVWTRLPRRCQERTPSSSQGVRCKLPPLKIRPKGAGGGGEGTNQCTEDRLDASA